MTPERRIARGVAGAAAAITVAAVALPPALYVGILHAREVGAVEAEGALLAHDLDALVTVSPTLWRFGLVRLRDALGRDLPAGEERILRAADGEEVVRMGTSPPWPRLARAFPVLDAGEPAGALELVRTLRPQVLRAAALFLALVPLGLLAFWVLSTVPLRAIARSEEAVLLAEERLREAQRLEALGRLAAGVAHDFNNILAAIRGFAGALRADLPADHPGRADAAEIISSADRAAALVRSLLAFGRQQALSMEVVDARALVAASERLLRGVAGDSVGLDLDLGDAAGAGAGALPVRADALQLEQVLMNLVANARDAMATGGRVRVAVRADDLSPEAAVLLGLAPGPHARVTVEDRGPGIPPDLRARLFEPFFTTKAQGKGTGLGLAIVHGIVQQHRGAVEVGEAPGGGAAFSVLLPLV